ncbi:RNA polymerase sigma factor [Butyrivibrio sp. FCS014]|uniref:RNA polymerase sigma factor n=1 Tax=Butyrivibrio sp. FCS014 TaxID=1408304 RepID=UPI0004677228|nr:RNA polymerase sigma factor [Butyrivibrio sp. FCS014]
MGKTDSKDKLIELMSTYKNLVFSVCLKLTGDYFAAEDITQETFISAYEHINEFDGSSEKAWLCRIASNKCIDYMRAAERRAVATSNDELPQGEALSRDGPLEQYVTADIMEAFRNSCDGLSEPYRTPAKLHFEEGLTAKEISMRIGVPLKTVQSHIYRAREMLKKTIRKEDLLA